MKTTPDYLKGCAIGCGVVLILVLLFGAGSFFWVRMLTNRAVDLREQLESTLPDQQSFTPSVDGTIAGDRIESFLEVRRRLMPFCEGFGVLADDMQSMNERVVELDASEEVAARDLFDAMSNAGRVSRKMFGIGQRLAEFSTARNAALLELEMGLGEYTWIYVIAYYSWLEYPPERFALTEESYPRIYRDRVSGNVRDMLERQIAAIEGSGVNGGEMQPRLETLRSEVAALDQDPERVPFAAATPPALAASLEPFRTELEAAYCAATSELDYMRTERDGLDHDHM